MCYGIQKYVLEVKSLEPTFLQKFQQAPPGSKTFATNGGNGQANP